MVDGLPSWLLGCYGNVEVHTKHIDLLAQTGTRFLNHFACSPLPESARAALLTGRTPMQLKDSGEVTLEKLLGSIGYACANTTGGAAALQFLDSQAAGKPFFLTANFAPFTNLPADPGEYANAKLDTLAQEAPAKNAARGKEMLGPGLLANLRKLAAATTALDTEIGSLTAKLTQKNLRDDTLDRVHRPLRCLSVRTPRTLGLRRRLRPRQFLRRGDRASHALELAWTRPAARRPSRSGQRL